MENGACTARIELYEQRFDVATGTFVSAPELAESAGLIRGAVTIALFRLDPEPGKTLEESSAPTMTLLCETSAHATLTLIERED